MLLVSRGPCQSQFISTFDSVYPPFLLRNDRTGSIESRSEKMNAFLKEEAHGRGINFIAHSMGGLDCRHLITHVKPKDYTPISLTSICTPHRGSPFMDWCMVSEFL